MAEMLRRINDRFHVDTEGIVIKTSNGQAIPEDEPIVLLRGRDRLAHPLLLIYRVLCTLDGCNSYFLGEVDRSIAQFTMFKVDHADRMKQPGVTKGK